MTFLLTFDPGMSTGITLGYFHTDDPYQRLGFWQVEGGLTGLKEWVWAWYDDYPDRWTFENADGQAWAFRGPEYVLVCEKFVPLPTARSFKTNELEALRIEGALEMAVRVPIWQRASAQVLSNEGVLPTMTARRKAAVRKRASDDVLRRMGLWTTGKQVGQKDANDVNSATKHAVSYLRSIKHEPTLKLLEG